MKAIHVTFDSELLERLDRRPEVRERGRSAILREMTAAYLTEKRSDDIAREYREGYTKSPRTDEEIQDWESIQVWSDDQGCQ
ncbi:MAG: ribbon-helix-helix protein, CopG family [Chloroflexi bacterium]|nr:ribbon-helix-helix protein, CopG family [Chloroflexota bacterium]